MAKFRVWLLSGWIVLQALSSSAIQDFQPLLGPVHEDTEWLTSYPSRLVGTEGHAEVQRQLKEKLTAIPNIQLYEQTFTLLTPQTIDCHFEILDEDWTGERSVQLYPFWPSGVRLNTTEYDGVTTEVLYIGSADYDEIPARSLRGRVAAMEVVGGRNWIEAMAFGGTAIIALGSDQARQIDFHEFLFNHPLKSPRFFLPDGEAAQALREGKIRKIKLISRLEWRESEARNYLALVAPEGGFPSLDGTKLTPEELNARQALCIVAPYDSMSLIPDLAPGADVAVDTATVLNACRYYAENPPIRPLLFAFIDGYGIKQRGMREMLVGLASTRREKKLQQLQDLDLLKEYKVLYALLQETEAAEEPLNVIYHYKGLRRYITDEVAREVVAIESILHPLRLKAHRLAPGPEKDRLTAQIDPLKEKRARFYAAQKLLVSSLKVDDANRELAQMLWDRVRRRIVGQLEELQQILERDNERDRLRYSMLIQLGLSTPEIRQAAMADDDKALEKAVEAAGLGTEFERPLVFVLAFDLSDDGIAAGPCLFDRLMQKDERLNSYAFRRWFEQRPKTDTRDIWTPEQMKAVNLLPLTTQEEAHSFVMPNMPSVTTVAQSWGTPAVTWMTLDCWRNKADTPYDLAQSLDWGRLDPQVDAALTLLDALAHDTTLGENVNVVPNWRRIEGAIVDVAAGQPVPSVPMEGYLTTFYNGTISAGVTNCGWLNNYGFSAIRQLEFYKTGIDGRFMMDAVPVHTFEAGGWFRNLFVQSYKLAEDGKIIRALDFKKSGKGVQATALMTSNKNAVLAVPFDCVELNTFDCFDPRFMIYLGNTSLLDVRRGGSPQRMNLSIAGGILSALVEPDMRWQLILRAGVTRNRMILVDMGAVEKTKGKTIRESMKGFHVDSNLPQHPYYMAARDFIRLDQRRLSDYESAGIKSKAIDDLTSQSVAWLKKSEDALKRDDGGDHFKYAGAALANEVRSYHAVRNTANDVIRGAIFLLLLLAPFSFALERLLFSFPSVYRQIVAMLCIFLVMGGILWSFHPAFRITSQPLMILMAFGIIFMSVLVIFMIYARFDSSLEEVRSGRAESSGAKTSRAGVATTAFRLGISNMRKRILRTTLTGITVVLVTFALLCFTSTSNYSGQKEYKLDAKPRFTGVLLSQPGSRAFDAKALSYLKTIVGDQFTMVTQYWWIDPWRARWRIHMANAKTGKVASLRACLGMSPDEHLITGIDKVCPNWDRFAEGKGCYISKSMSEELEVQAGDTVVLNGIDLELLGTFESDAFDEHVQSITGDPVTPVDYESIGTEQRNTIVGFSLEALAMQIESGAMLEDNKGLLFISSKTIAVVPSEVLDGQSEVSMRSVAIPTKSADEAQQLAGRLIQRLAFPIFYSSGDNVRVVATTPLLPKPPKSLLIPLLIAGLIIFNTMLSSIAERRGEIHIYTSLGLAPLHVGFLFLAEAVTYGLMGSIFGYVVGQGVATVFSNLGWMGGLTLNYSGTQTIFVMALVIGVVIISSLIPAYLAGKLAVPSNEMTWSVPRPEGDTIRASLPFTVNARTANGMMAFLLEYFDAHREGSIGHFSTDNLQTKLARTGELDVVMIEGRVWLAPYDLGVRQEVCIRIEGTGDSDVYSIELELHRGAGQVNSWWRLNRTFIADLRKQLLGWRKLRAERALAYIHEGDQLLQQSMAQ
ncbi:ABC transporter permease [Candidatus Sumerlaeota bacterium]|nr:ABC transporter permease [Candidatus Sumerlaeota bacterium]